MPKHPIQLKNPPIIESIIEIKFNSFLPDEVVFGVFYSKVGEKYNKIEELHTSKIPKEIVENEPSLKYAPHYVLRSEKSSLLLMIGPKVLIFKYQKHQDLTIKYPGWHDYIYNEIMDTLKQIVSANYIKEVLRVGLRTIDFFEVKEDEDVFSNLKISINMLDKDLNGLDKSVRFNIKENGFDNTIAISNNSSLIIKNELNKGATIDIDTSKEEVVSQNIENYLSKIIESGHEINKDLFFSLLKDEYVEVLVEK